MVSAARRTSTDSTGLALCGIVDDPPPAALGRARRSRAGDRVSTSLAIRAPGVGAAHQRVAEPGDGRPGGVPGRPWREAERAATWSRSARSADRVRRAAASSTAAASVPAAPPSWTGQGQRRRRSSYASRTPVSQPAALRPNVVGTACWVRVRATIGRRAVLLGQAGERGRPGRASSARIAATASRAQQHQRGVDDVLAGQAAVQPRGPRRVASRAARAAARPAGSPGCRRPPRRSPATRRARRRRARAGRPRPRPVRRPRRPGRRARPPRRPTIASSDGRVREAGRRRARRPARTGHAMPRQCRGWVRKTVSPSPCRRMSKTQPAAVLGRRPASRGGPLERRPAAGRGQGVGVAGQVGAGEQPVRAARGRRR